MTATVKLFTYRGIVQAPVVTQVRESADSVYMLEQPYLARETLTADVAAVTSAAFPANTGLVRVEVQDGQTINYEVNPPGRNVAASANSPSLSGKDQFHCAAGWSLSVILGP